MARERVQADVNGGWEERLHAEPLRFVSARGFFSRRPPERVLRCGKDWLLIATSDERWAYLLGDSPEATSLLIERAYHSEGLRAFAVLEEWQRPLVQCLAPSAFVLTCSRLYLPAERTLPAPTITDAELCSPLETDDVPAILRHSAYAAYLSERYLKEALAEGFSAGIRLEQDLVAWAVCHDDLAIGNLHVLPCARRRGYGAALVSLLSRRLRSAGELPVMNIEDHNRPSLALAESLGFLPDRRVSWVKLEG
jgi:8-oxo-dGTP diphosphatase